MKVLVTGSARFIAGYLVQELLDNGHEVVGIDNFSKYGEVEKSYLDHPRYRFVRGDVRDAGLLTDLAGGCEHFIACAAMIGGISYFHEYAYDLLATNERIIAASFDAAIAAFQKSVLKNITVLSSSMVYEIKRAENGADVVCASRYMRGGKQIGGPWFKGLLSRTAGVSLYWLAGLPTHDPTNSFKAYSSKFLSRAVIESTAGFALSLELTVKAHFSGGRVEEVPAIWYDRTAGSSRFRLWHWLPHYLRWYFLAIRCAWINVPRRISGIAG